MSVHTKKIALIGGGPSALFMYKRLVESKAAFKIEIFEKSGELGPGMPYGKDGACIEHVTNVSGSEIPDLVTTVNQWIETVPIRTLERFGIQRDSFSKHHVMPRLIFGKYLAAQFKLLRKQAARAGISTTVHLGVGIQDIVDRPEDNLVYIRTDKSPDFQPFDAVIICSGHRWLKKHEGKVKGYFDSPYPPAKLQLRLNHPVAIRGASLTAIDAIRTLARHNGHFHRDDDDKLVFSAHPRSAKFKLVLHSRNGLLPAIRFHLAEPQLSGDSLMSKEEIFRVMKENNGFLPLDYIFDENFKKAFIRKDPKFYRRIKNMSIEKFVSTVMDMREGKEPFQLFREEYAEAEKSIAERKSIYWKETLAELSFTLNYPAKYFSAEDMLRLKKVLMPLISMVIAFVPQSSCDELMALHDAGRLEIVSVGADSSVEPQKEGGILYKYEDEKGKSHSFRYKTFVDCIGQQQLSYRELPFEGLITRKSISQATIRFASAQAAVAEIENGNDEIETNGGGQYLLKVPGITINDHFQIVNEYGIGNERVYIMAVPYMGGYNPDYSGLDFCEQASGCISEKLIA